ncbi:MULTISPECIES: HNH endonuclease signature motif containing protein [unclassified Actinotalea]|uniref:HNH endonuclease n=1 Tax=unclassified Actinotalea TaxID=2638618 RepID=UPI0015F6F914|nr:MULTISPECIES: HNH endonuclease signature motif containing protein [unclassified Actinotalea]
MVQAASEAAGVAGLDALLARLRADAAALAAMALGSLEGPRAAAVRRDLRVVGDQIHLAASVLLAAVEADGRWALGGADRTVAGHVARREGIAYGDAARQAQLGRAMGELPVVREAVASGEITRGHAEALSRLVSSPARRAALASDLPDRNEAFFVDQARRLGVDEFRRLTSRMAAKLDDQAAEREHRQAVARQRLTLTPRGDGLALSGFLTHENGQLLATAVRSIAGVPTKDDQRPVEQRQAEALVDLARLVLDRGLTGAGAQVRPHLSVHVSWETYQRLATDAAARDAAEAAARGTGGTDGAGGRDGAGARDSAGGTAHQVRRTGLETDLVDPAEFESGEPVPASVLQRIACDSQVTRIVFGPDSQILNVGQDERTYTKQLRRAVIARDRHCQYPGCTAPPTLGEIHHIRWWSHGGDTSTDNGILLCWHHHDHIHTHDLRITRVPHGFEFRHPDGRPAAQPEHASGAPPATGTRPPPGGETVLLDLGAA